MISEICATLYEHVNYGGWAKDVIVGSGKIEDRNDRASSVKVTKGCEFEAYKDFNLHSFMFRTTKDMKYLGSYNDKLSMYKCSCDG